MDFRSALQLVRAHTAPLEAVPAAMGALIVTGGSVTFGVLYWTLFGVVYHFAGYGMNSLRDWQKGYDKDDEYKSHHPLNDGQDPLAIRQIDAAIIIIACFFGAFAMAIAGSYAGESPILSITVVVVMVASGVVYNEAGKETLLKPIPISIAHSTVFLLPYVASGGSDPLVALVGTAFVFMWVLYQIGVSGEVKDLYQEDEVNLLRRIGVWVDRDSDYIMFTTSASFVGILGRAVVVMSVIPWIAVQPEGQYYNITILICGLVAVFSLLLAHNLIRPGEYNRPHRVKVMSFIEITSMVLFVVGGVGAIGPKIAGVILLGSFAWLAVMNYLEWGTVIEPKV